MRASLCLASAFAGVAAVSAAGGTSTADAMESDMWVPFPSQHGVVLVHKDCVHHVGGEFHIDASRGEGDLLTHGPNSQELPPCPYAPRWTNVTAKGASVQADKPSLGYYSDWVAYAQVAHAGGYGFMTSDWKVPAAPKSSGPVPGMSSAYLFNGLEDGGGHKGASTFIMQPVLSYGKSGCVVNPVNFFKWHFIAFLVTGAGRAYCGSRMVVNENEPLRGVMRLGKDGKTWTVEATRLSTNETSTYSSDLGGKKVDAAYLTLETMISYSCKAFPASGSVTFDSNALQDESGKGVDATKWVKMLRHTECNQEVTVGADGAVTISWDAAANANSKNRVLV